jgi:predicted HicB family RNase H-like nuclease
MCYSPEDKLYYGALLGISDVNCFHGNTEAEFIRNFHTSVDDYLTYCKELNREPDKTREYAMKLTGDPAESYLSYLEARKQGEIMTHGFSDAWTNHFYVISKTFSEEQVKAMSKQELNDLIVLASAIIEAII